MYSTIFLVSTIIGLAVGEPTGSIIPCKKGDDACIKSSANKALHIFIGGFPELGVEPSDPMTIDEVVGDLSGLKYTFTASTVNGLKNCDMNDAKMDVDNLKLKFSFVCKNVNMNGHYTISGQLLILPVEGEGPYSIDCKQFFFTIEGDLKMVEGSDGQKHIALKSYKLTSEAREGIVYDFRNLFNGQKDLADAVLKFANENWKEVADFVQEPVMSAIMKKAVKNMNKYLKLIPVSDLYQD